MQPYLDEREIQQKSKLSNNVQARAPRIKQELLS